MEQGTAALTVDKALSIDLSDPPGPVLLELPDEYLHSAHWQEPDRAPAPPRLAEPGHWAEDSKTLQQARAMLRKAKKPVIPAGLGAIHHAAAPAILELARNHRVPVVTTYKAKGILPEDHPMAMGGHGLSPLSDKIILPLLADSDCVILAGYDPIEMRSDWINPWQPENAIEILHAANEHRMHGAAVRFVGDAGFDMVAGDLSTLRDLQLPLVIVVPIDNSLALIERKHTAMQLNTYGVQFAAPDIPAVAQAYGGIGQVICNSGDLQTALADAWGRNRFTVLACLIDKSAYNGAF